MKRITSLLLIVLAIMSFASNVYAQTFIHNISKNYPIHGGDGVSVTAIRQTNSDTIVTFEIDDTANRDKNGNIRSGKTFSVSSLLYLLPADVIKNNFKMGIIPWSNDANKLRSTLSLFQATSIEGIEFNQSYYYGGGIFNVHFAKKDSRIAFGHSEIYLVELVNDYYGGSFVGYRLGFKWKINLDIPYPDVGNINKSEKEIKDWISENNNGLYGIYKSGDPANTNDYTIAYVKDVVYGDVLVYLGSGKELPQWKIGDIKATLEPTATKGFYAAKWRLADKHEEAGYFVSFDPGFLTVNSQKYGKEMYIKMFPSAESPINSNKERWSGTGFALKDGYIVTNHHVANNAKSIKVYGVNGNTSKAYNATVVAFDKNNDLALIKINDDSFDGFNTIPYSVKTSMAEVGESVFVLGYPLTSYLGNEVKLTNGIISSRSGFEGDISTYQISAPIHNGNSGGPVFDEKGNVIGIVNAFFTGGDNVSYAIKTSYLKNLIENVTSSNLLPSSNQISNMTLPQKVAKVRDFVFFIMCEGESSE